MFKGHVAAGSMVELKFDLHVYSEIEASPDNCCGEEEGEVVVETPFFSASPLLINVNGDSKEEDKIVDEGNGWLRWRDG